MIQDELYSIFLHIKASYEVYTIKHLQSYILFKSNVKNYTPVYYFQ
jgi:hypothetical protein